MVIISGYGYLCPTSFSRQKNGQLILCMISILKLIHQKIFELLLILFQNVWSLPEKNQSFNNQISKIHQPLFHLQFIIGFEGFGQLQRLPFFFFLNTL